MIKDEMSRVIWTTVMITSWVSFMTSLWIGIIIHYQYAIFSIAWIVIFIIGAAIKASKGK